MIWEEIQKSKKVKPIYASMSDVAASGGYYIPMGCDTIIASPYTITGSIGVISVIPNFSGTINKVGVTVDTINMGKSSQFMNPLFAYTDADKARLKGLMEPIYTSFVTKAAQSRKKSYEEMRMLAKGRVWTGEDAHKNGLVDVLGGFQTAIDIAKKRIGVKKGNKVRINYYPQTKDKFQELLESFGIGKKQDEEEALMNEQFKSFIGNAVLESVSEKSALPLPVRQQVTDALSVTRIGMKEKVQMVLPYSVHFE
jgi:protease-4